MKNKDRFTLFFGPYVAPKCKVGDTLPCEYRGREVEVGGMTDAPIQWPYRKGRGRPSCIVCGDLIRAVEKESEIAVAHHWGVSAATVVHWRAALSVPRMNSGSRLLAIAYAPERLNDEARARGNAAMRRPEVREKLSAAKKGCPPKLDRAARAAQRAAASKPKSEEWKRATSERMKELWEHPEEHGLTLRHRWTDDEVARLGTVPDPQIARELNIPVYIVEQKRRRLGIRGKVDRWSDEHLKLLGTNLDREVARLVGRNEAAVRRKRQSLGIPPFSARWSEEEIALLGTDTDRAIAEKLGRTSSAVETKRYELGMVSYRRSRRDNRE